MPPGSASSAIVRPAGRPGTAYAVAAITDARPDLHRAPPTTLRRIRQRWPWLVPAALVLAGLLAALASVRNGALLVWDRPITSTTRLAS